MLQTEKMHTILIINHGKQSGTQPDKSTNENKEESNTSKQRRQQSE